MNQWIDVFYFQFLKMIRMLSKKNELKKANKKRN